MAKSVITKFTCDECKKDINLSYDFLHPSVALDTGTALEFSAWADDLAETEDMLHFHDDPCATSYLVDWLDRQRPTPQAVEPAPPATEIVVELADDGIAF